MKIRCPKCDPNIEPLERDSKGQFLPRFKTAEAQDPHTSFICQDCGHEWGIPHKEVKHR